MNLIIDVGNTFVKFAVFQQNTIVERNAVPTKDFLIEFKKILEKYPEIEKSILSSVGNVDAAHFKIAQSSLKMLVLDSNLLLPFKNLYQTPHTLGVDRIALVAAAIEQFPKKDTLIIDAGTCITYDFVNAANEYLGGSISPGLRLRYQSLHNLTANLPLLETKVPKQITGNSTETSIHSGVVFGVLKEIDGVIKEYQFKYTDLTVILTGGDSDFLSKQLKNGIFANSNFLLEGLNFILEYNSN